MWQYSRIAVEVSKDSIDIIAFILLLFLTSLTIASILNKFKVLVVQLILITRVFSLLLKWIAWDYKLSRNDNLWPNQYFNVDWAIFNLVLDEFKIQPTNCRNSSPEIFYDLLLMTQYPFSFIIVVSWRPW